MITVYVPIEFIGSTFCSGGKLIRCCDREVVGRLPPSWKYKDVDNLGVLPAGVRTVRYVFTDTSSHPVDDHSYEFEPIP